MEVLLLAACAGTAAAQQLLMRLRCPSMYTALQGVEDKLWIGLQYG